MDGLMILKSKPLGIMAFANQHSYMLLVDGVANLFINDNDGEARRAFKESGTDYETIQRWTADDGTLACGGTYIPL